MADTDTDLQIDDEEELLNFVLYFVLTCIAVFFLIIIFFMCFSGRICVYIYYMVYKFQVIVKKSLEEPKKDVEFLKSQANFDSFDKL